MELLGDVQVRRDYVPVGPMASSDTILSDTNLNTPGFQQALRQPAQGLTHGETLLGPACRTAGGVRVHEGGTGPFHASVLLE